MLNTQLTSCLLTVRLPQIPTAHLPQVPTAPTALCPRIPWPDIPVSWEWRLRTMRRDAIGLEEAVAPTGVMVRMEVRTGQMDTN
jgi:hypothetical protein